MCPVVSIASTDTNLFYAPALAVPRLEVTPSSWEAVVAFLVWAAQMIVVDCVELTPGVRFELGLIRFLGKATQSVVVLPSHETVQRMRRSDMYPRAPTPQPEQIASLGFGRAVLDASLQGARLEEVAEIADLLPPRRAQPIADPDEQDIDGDLIDLAISHISRHTNDSYQRALEILNYLWEEGVGTHYRLSVAYHMGVAYRQASSEYAAPYARLALAALTAGARMAQVQSDAPAELVQATYLALAKTLSLPGIRLKDIFHGHTVIETGMRAPALAGDTVMRVRIWSTLAAAYLHGKGHGPVRRQRAEEALEILRQCDADLNATADEVPAAVIALVRINSLTARIVTARTREEVDAAEAERMALGAAFNGFEPELLDEIADYGSLAVPAVPSRE